MAGRSERIGVWETTSSIRDAMLVKGEPWYERTIMTVEKDMLLGLCHEVLEWKGVVCKRV